MIVGGAYNSGLLADPNPGTHYNYLPAPQPLIERAQQLQAICARHGVPLKAAAIQFPAAHPCVAAVLTGSRRAAELDRELRPVRPADPGGPVAGAAGGRPARRACARTVMTIPPPTGVTVDAHHHLWDPAQGDYPWMTGRFAPLRREYAPPSTDPRTDRARRAGHGRGPGPGRRQRDPGSARADHPASLPGRRGRLGGPCFGPGCAADRGRCAQARAASAWWASGTTSRRNRTRNGCCAPTCSVAWRTVADAGLAFDLEVTPRELAAAVQVAAAHPDLRFVLDHLGKPPIAAGGSGLWRRGFAQLAALGNVWCKLSGLVTEANWDRWTDADLAPYISEAVEQFGVSRLLFGSDWPVCELAASYGQVLTAVRHGLTALDPAQTGQVFGLNAVEVYRLDLCPSGPAICESSRSAQGGTND